MRTQRKDEKEAQFMSVVLGLMPHLKELTQRGTVWIGLFKNGMRFRSSDTILTQLVQQGK